MTDKKPPLTDYQKTVFTSKEQKFLELGAHVVRNKYSEEDIDMAKSLIQTIRRLTGEPPLTEDELDLIIERAKNKTQF